jgi:hypothetical protein
MASPASRGEALMRRAQRLLDIGLVADRAIRLTDRNARMVLSALAGETEEPGPSHAHSHHTTLPPLPKPNHTAFASIASSQGARSAG